MLVSCLCGYWLVDKATSAERCARLPLTKTGVGIRCFSLHPLPSRHLPLLPARHTCPPPSAHSSLPDARRWRRGRGRLLPKTATATALAMAIWISLRLGRFRATARARTSNKMEDAARASCTRVVLLARRRPRPFRCFSSVSPTLPFQLSLLRPIYLFHFPSCSQPSPRHPAAARLTCPPGQM